MGDGYQEVQEVISIHAPTRGATIPNIDIPDVAGFQSTLPREERLSFPCNISFHLIFQSTLPREERQHTIKFLCVMSDFNPRSHERSDRYNLKCLMFESYFNPRSHERSDSVPAYWNFQ